MAKDTALTPTDQVAVVAIVGVAIAIAGEYGPGVDGILGAYGFGLRVGAHDPQVAALLADNLDATFAGVGRKTTAEFAPADLTDAVRGDLAANGVSLTA